MKRIVHILSTKEYSGAENVVSNIIKMVDNYEQYYVSPSGKINRILLNLKINHIKMKKFSYKHVKDVINCYKPDIIQGHDFKASFLIALYRILYWRKHKNTIFISHLHNNDPRMKKISLCSVLYLICSILIDKIVVVSNSVIDEYIYSSLIKNKVVVINNTINTQIIDNKVSLSNPEKTDIIFLARFVDQKDPIRFIKIVNILHKEKKLNIKVEMIGEDGGLKEEMIEMISHMKLQHIINIRSFQPNPYPFINKASILVLTSKYEGFGLVALEALHLGKPVVCSEVGGLLNVVDSSCGKLCKDDEHFIDEIYKLLTDQSYYYIKSKAARKKSDMIISSQNFKNKWREVYC